MAACEDSTPAPPAWAASSDSGVIAAGAAEAVSSGAVVLEEGGNAADAAVTTILALTVTDHGYCSIGGEVPLLFYEQKTGLVTALSGQGGAPLSLEAIAWYLEHGIPVVDDIRMAPVPAVIDLCVTTLQMFGTISLERAIEPSRELLTASREPWSANLGRTFERLVAAERHASGTREEKLQAASDFFYARSGCSDDIGHELAEDYRRLGGFLGLADLAAHTTKVETPVSATYRGFRVYKCGPWTQGPMLLQALRLLEGLDVRGLGYMTADYIHVVIEVIKLAMADRDTYYGDPDFVDVPLDRLLSDAYTAMRRRLVDPKRASQEVRPGDVYGMNPTMAGGVIRPAPPGTTTCVVADRFGNVVSATPSANVDRASDGGQTGVTYGNRLTSFNTAPGHPNRIEPGKRPRITLTPTLVLNDSAAIAAISVAGGDMQDQISLAMLLGWIDFGVTPERAVTTPRFVTSHHQYSFDPAPDRASTYRDAGAVRVSYAIPESVRSELAARGHTVHALKRPIGAPVMLCIDPKSGAMMAAGDPAAGRNAVGVS